MISHKLMLVFPLLLPRGLDPEVELELDLNLILNLHEPELLAGDVPR